MAYTNSSNTVYYIKRNRVLKCEPLNTANHLSKIAALALSKKISVKSNLLQNAASLRAHHL